MITLSVPDMHCGKCKAGVERALTAVDPAARVEVDLTARRVSVETLAPLPALLAALGNAGFPASAT